MKQHLWKGIVAAVCMLLLTGASASAQMVGPEKELIEVTVPFEFTVDETRFSPGEFVVEQFAEKTSNEMVIYPKGDEDRRETFVVEQLADHNYVDADETELVFDRVDGERHLAEVWIARKGVYRVGTVEPDDRVRGDIRLNDPDEMSTTGLGDESMDESTRAADSDREGDRYHETMKDEDDAEMSADIEPDNR